MLRAACCVLRAGAACCVLRVACSSRMKYMNSAMSVKECERV